MMLLDSGVEKNMGSASSYGKAHCPYPQRPMTRS